MTYYCLDICLTSAAQKDIFFIQLLSSQCKIPEPVHSRYIIFRHRTGRDTDDTDENTARYRTIYFHFPVVKRGHKCTHASIAHGLAAVDRTCDISWFRGRVLRTSRMSYCEISRNAQNSIKLFHQCGKKEGKDKGDEGSKGGAQSRPD